MDASIRSESNEFADFGLVVLIKRIDDGESRFMVFEPYQDQGEVPALTLNVYNFFNNQPNAAKLGSFI